MFSCVSVPCSPCRWLFKHHTTTNNVIPCMMICNHNAISNGSNATDTSKFTIMINSPMPISGSSTSNNIYNIIYSTCILTYIHTGMHTYILIYIKRYVRQCKTSDSQVLLDNTFKYTDFMNTR